jgi:osmotically-inducible protein OsmY
MITIKPKLNPFELEQKITAAFRRNATVDASKVTVSTIGSKVILTGKVRSLAESEDAENAAWAAPGVYDVDNKLTIEEPELVY